MDGIRWHERAWIRLAVYLLAGGVAAALDPRRDFWVKGLAGWIVASTAALAYQGWMIARSNAEQTRRRASLEDPGRTVVWLMILAACLFSLVASLVLMGEKDLRSHAPEMLACLWAVLSSWFLTHTSFTLRYAHLYYRDDRNQGGLEFPGDQPPDDWDFAYYAFTIGMCFQTSDVSVSDRSIRRTTLLHSIISFFFNTAILALTFNLIMGHLGNLVSG
ncbi:DUF1345 domain-containing protein [bacterium]|nr:DUF1345 domain-containing protein [bacterium]